LKKWLIARFILVILILASAIAAHAQQPVPTILNLNPPFAVVTSGGFTLNVTGNNFDNTAVVNWNGSARATTYLSSSQLTATILQSDIATMQAVQVTVTTDGGTSNGFGFQILGPLAVVNSWSPTNFTAGAGATITVYGQNFLPGCVVLFNWSPLTTSYVSSTQLTASVSGTTVTTSGPQNIVVTNPLFPAAPGISLSPAQFAFGSVVVGTTTSAQTTTLTNAGNATLTISSITATPNFAVSATTCGSTLAPAATCTISVDFTPAATVGYFGHVSITDNASNNLQVLPLSGQGYTLAPVVSLLFTSHDYGPVAETGASAVITEMITNTGNANLTFSAGDTVTGPNAADFTIGTDTCGSSAIAPTAQCSTNVTFNPSTGGAESATLVYSTNAGTVNIPLSGTGVANAPVVQFATTTLAFGSEVQGSTTSALTETVTNSGNANLTFPSNPVISGANAADFTISTEGCTTSTTVTPTSNCATHVTFTPSTTSTETAQLVYTDNAANSPQSVSLTGTGVPTAAGATLSVSTIAFGNVASGGSSPATAVTLTNSGGTTLTISSIALGGTNPSDFSKTTTCSGTLASLASCTVSVTFSPASVASYSATLTFTDSASSSPQTVSLSGTGISSGSPTFSPSSSTLAFGSGHQTQTWSTINADVAVPMNTSSPGTPLTTATANAGTVSYACPSCSWNNPVPSGFEVGANNGCSNLGPVQMNGAGGPLYAAGSLNYNSYGHLDSANSVINNLDFPSNSSTNVSVNVCLSLGWPAQSNGNDWDMIMIQDQSGLYADLQFNAECPTSSAGFGVRIENHAVQHSACVALTNQQAYFFSLNWNLGSGEATVYVYTPAGVLVGSASESDPSSGTLENIRFFSNENGTNAGTYSLYQNILVNYSTGPNPYIWTGGSPAIPPLTETITNTGTQNLVFTTAPAISGTNAADFTITGETCTTSTPVAASGTCTTTVTFTPSTTSSESATLTYTDNASGSPHTVSLTGNGTGPATHSVTLSWTASSSPDVVGYNVLRGVAAGGPYGTLLTPTPINATSYTDNTVADGTTYYYVIQAVGSNPPYVDVDSANSSQTTAVIP
jgi:hypothetical protein